MDIILTDEEIYNIILEILVGKKYYYSNLLNEHLIFTNPTGEFKLYLNLYEKQQLEKYLEEGYISEIELNQEILEQIFTVEDQELLQEIQNKIKAYKTILIKRPKDSQQYQVDKKKLFELQVSETDLLNKRNSLNSFTAEYKAKEDKYFLLASNQIITEDGHKKWRNSEEFINNFNELIDLYGILNEYLNFYFGYNISLIRQVARNSQFRNYYISSVKGLFPLFHSKTEDLSFNQLNLLAWASFYSDIQEMPLKDRPSEEVLKDDERLDKYISEYTRKIKAEVEVERKSSILKTSKADNHQHVVVSAESENYVTLHKQDMYSDPKLVTGRVDTEAKRYNEKEERLKISKKLSGINRKQ